MDQVFLFLFTDIINLNFNYTCTVDKCCSVFVCDSAPHPPPTYRTVSFSFTLYCYFPCWHLGYTWDYVVHFSVNHYMALGFYWCSWFSGPWSEYLPEPYFPPGTFSDKKTAVVWIWSRSRVGCGGGMYSNPASFPVCLYLSSNSVHVSKSVFLLPSHLNNTLLGY